jgi:two-component system chemotaxis response regulator CheY
MEDEVLALIVDDSRAMRAILTRTLSSFGFETVEADNGRTGLDALRAMPAPPDVVLVDWNMPELDGLEFVCAVRSQPAWRAVRIMMVTNESEQGRIGRALVAGAHDYLIKPFTLETVRDRLNLLGLLAETATGPRPDDHRSAGTSIDANQAGPQVCDCCAGTSAVVYYPLDEPLEQDDDVAPIDRIHVCARCFELVETGHWSDLRHWIGSAANGRAIRHLWMGLRQHRVGPPLPAQPAPILKPASTMLHAAG